MGRGLAQKSIDLVDAAYDILEEIQPATVRAVGYRLWVAKFTDGMSKSNMNMLSRHLVRERLEGRVPWEWIADEQRAVDRPATWRDPEERFEFAVLCYRRDYWQDQSGWVEAWSEKGTVSGTIAPILDEYGVVFRLMKGHTSATTVRNAAKEAGKADKLLTVLYLGDWDPSGAHMSEVDLPARLADVRYGGRGRPINIVRVAIAAKDRNKSVPSFPASDKKNDSRYAWFVENHGDTCWELDALSPVVLRERIEEEIVKRIDQDAWQHALKLEAAERSSMQAFVKGWSKCGRANKCRRLKRPRL